MSNPSPLKTRKLTGKVSWPIGLIAGVEKAGKSHQVALAAAESDLIGETYWINVGEDHPDEYGSIPGGDRINLVEHEGTYRSTLNAVLAAVAAPRTDPDKPNLLVFESASREWALLTGNAQETANQRAAKKGWKIGDDGAQITMDLWNTAKQRWNHILDALRLHDGPVLITCRLELVSVVDERGEPTKEKWWKPVAEKNLPYDVGFVVQMRASYPDSKDETYLTQVRSLRYKHPTGKKNATALTDFSVDSLWRQLGLADGDVAPRGHSHTVAQGEVSERDDLLRQIAAAADAAGITRAQVANEWAEYRNGQPISQATDLGGLELLRDDLTARANSERGATDQRAGESPGQAEQRAQEDNARADDQQDARASETQHARADNRIYRQTDEARAEEQRAQNGKDDAPAKTGHARLVECAEEEIAYQVEWLGENFEEYIAPLVGDSQISDLPQAKIKKWVLDQRPRAAAALRAQGKATLANVYERAPFPVSMNTVFELADREDARERQPANA